MSKKIILFTSDLYEGGVAESTRKIANLLSNKNEVVVCAYDSVPIKKAMCNKIRVINLNLPLSSGFRNGAIGRFFTRIARYIFFPFAIAKMLTIIWRLKPDVVYSLTYIPNVVNIICSFFIKYKTIVSERQDPIEDLGGKSILGKVLCLFYPYADLVHVNSPEMISSVSEFYKLSREKIYHFDNFFFENEIADLAKEDVNDYSFDSPVLVCSGRLTKQKGQWHLIDIFDVIQKKNPDVKLLLLGSGELKIELELKVKKMGIDDKVTFMGNVDNPHKYVARSKIFIFPSLWESFGNSLVEAMCLGIPVVSTTCKSGPGYIIENGKYGLSLGVLPKYGEVLDEEQKVILANKIMQLLLPEQYDEYSERSRSGYFRFDSRSIQKDLEILFD